MPDALKREQAEYLDAIKLVEMGVPLRVLIMAAIITEDEKSYRLERAYPVLWAETMKRRFDSPDGSLPGDQQLDDEPAPLTALCREED